MTNLLNDVPEHCEDEVCETIVETDGMRIERIISYGQASPEGFWYDQDRDEWVVLLSGAARLRWEDSQHTLDMNPGDHVHIPAHRRHRVEWTAPNQASVWLAIHFEGDRHLTK